MLFEFINSDGKFYKNVAFIGFKLTVYTGGEIDHSITFKDLPKYHQVLWRFK